MLIAFLSNILIFALGLCIGSFLNCVIYRLESKKTLKGRSFCPSCKHALAWHDLFPVFSFLFLGGRCRYCKAKISWQYPAVEISTALIFLLIFSGKGLTASGWNFLSLMFLFYVASVLVIIFVYDLKHYLIPDKVLFPAIIIALAYRLLENLNFEFITFLGYLLAVLIGAGFFLGIFLLSRGRWMGFGDVKLAVLMGLVLGLKHVLLALFLAFFLGAIIGVILIAFDKKGLKSEIPFGPFLIAGTFVSMLWGVQLINWYMKLFLT